MPGWAAAHCRAPARPREPRPRRSARSRRRSAPSARQRARHRPTPAPIVLAMSDVCTMTYEGPRSTPTRKRDRVSHDGPGLCEFLDAHYLGHLAWVSRGFPQALPMLYARAGDRLLLHGSTGGAAALVAREGGVPAAFTVTAV